MYTRMHNAASQRGIEKAGLVKQGRIVRLIFPFVSENFGFAYRPHRWRSLAITNNR